MPRRRGLGYEGGYDAVRRFAKGWSQSRGAATAEAYVPLCYAPGEAYQFDWSHEVIVISGVMRESQEPQPSGSNRWHRDGFDVRRA